MDATSELTTTDLYEVGYYLCGGCLIESIQCVEQAGKETCIFTITGNGLARLQLEYLEGRARVNLLAFRRAYNQAFSYANQGRRRFRLSKSGSGLLPAGGREGGPSCA
jgi:hypothetical protein